MGIDLVTYLTVLIGLLVLDEQVSEAPDRGTAPFIGLGLVMSALLFILVPAVLPSRAGPGTAAVDVALRSVDGGPARRWSLVVRWALRWLPFVLLGLVGFVVMVVIDAVVAWRRADARSLSDLVSRTVLRTNRSVDASREDSSRA